MVKNHAVIAYSLSMKPSIKVKKVSFRENKDNKIFFYVNYINDYINLIKYSLSFFLNKQTNR